MTSVLTEHADLILAAAGGGGGSGGVSILEMVRAGGTIGFIIILLSLVAVTLAVMHALNLRQSALAPVHVQEELERLLSKGNVDGALAFCTDESGRSFLGQVMASGLSRYKRSPFGALELKGALEEAGQEQVAKLYRSTDGLSLVATIAPMLGLLGTVVGINGAFATISTGEGFGRPDQLAGDISLALVTTIMGLVLAIPATAAVTYFRNRIDSLATSIAVIVDDLAAHVENEGLESAPPTGNAG